MDRDPLLKKPLPLPALSPGDVSPYSELTASNRKRAAWFRSVMSLGSSW